MLTTTCREVQNLLELFFDSELDSRQMRVVALHSATCAQCENELRGLERLQDVVARSVSERVDEIDLSQVWFGIEDRLPPRRTSRLNRVRVWWSEQQWGWSVPAFGAAAAVAVAIIVALGLGRLPIGKTIEVAMENPVSVHEISSDDHVALLTEADTLLLWVDHELAGEAVDTGEPVDLEAYQ